MLALQAFEPCLVKDLNARQSSIKLIPNFKRFFQNQLRPNYLKDVSVLVNKLYFKSNLGKVTLSENDCLEFDPMEIKATASQKTVDLIVFAYTMPNLVKISVANPFDLAHTFSFRLRLVEPQTLEKIIEDQMPKKEVTTIQEEESLYVDEQFSDMKLGEFDRGNL